MRHLRGFVRYSHGKYASAGFATESLLLGIKIPIGWLFSMTCNYLLQLKIFLSILACVHCRRRDGGLPYIVKIGAHDVHT